MPPVKRLPAGRLMKRMKFIKKRIRFLVVLIHGSKHIKGLYVEKVQLGRCPTLAYIPAGVTYVLKAINKHEDGGISCEAQVIGKRKRKEKSAPAKRPRALRTGSLTSKIERVSPKGPQA
eukprot:1138229-Pelagomonas_calceolata.AAC.8